MTHSLRKACCLFLAIAVMLGSSAAATADEPDGPTIYIEKKRHDFGEVYERKSFVHTFEVKNIGNKDLIIESVKPGCGCTVAEYDEVIAPGGVGKITLDLDGGKVDGSFTKSATITSNDTEHPKVSISLGGTILRYLTVEPKRVYLRGMYGEAVERELTITSIEKKHDFKVLEVNSTIDDKMTYRVEADPEPGVYKIKLFKNPKLPTMNTWGTLFINTNNEHTPQKAVQVNVITQGAIVVEPSIVNFGSVDAAKLAGANRLEQELTVSKLNGDFNITEITFSSDRYEATVEPLGDGKYRVIVGFRPAGGDRTYADEMVINTDDPQEPTLRVRLVARGV